MYVRFYDQSNRRYVMRSLKTSDIGEATDRAIGMWRDIQPRIEQGHPTDRQTIAATIETYLKEEQARVDAGVVLQGSVRDKRAQLKVLLVFCGLNGLTTVGQVREHSFNDFVAWRRDESRRITEGKNERLKPTSLNKSIREVRAWWKWCRKKRLTTVELELMEQVVRGERERTRNVAFAEDDWIAIEHELVRRSKETQGKRRELLPTQVYGRWMFKTLIQVLVHSGLRPQEATQHLRWRHIKFLEKGARPIDKLMDGSCVIRVENPSGKGSRSVACDAGVFFKLFQSFCVKWRRAVAMTPMTKDVLVFGNPLDGQPYAYSMFGNEWRALLDRLELRDKGYTIRSCRGYYASRMLAAGGTPYLLAKNLGHSIKVLERDYEQLTEQELIEAFLEAD